jgi:hypothetical protein
MEQRPGSQRIKIDEWLNSPISPSVTTSAA